MILCTYIVQMIFRQVKCREENLSIIFEIRFQTTCPKNYDSQFSEDTCFYDKFDDFIQFNVFNNLKLLAIIRY